MDLSATTSLVDVPAFALAAAVTAAVVLGTFASVVRAGRRARARSHHDARIHATALAAAEAFVSGMAPPLARTLLRLLDDPRTCGLALDAVAHAAARPGANGEPLRTLVSGSRAPGWLAGELATRDLDRVVAALEHVRELRVVECRAAVVHLVAHPDPTVRKAAHRALVEVDPAGALGELLRRTDASHSWADELIVAAAAAVPEGDLPGSIVHRVPIDAVRARPTPASPDRASGTGASEAEAEGLDDRRVAALVAALEHGSDYLRLLAVRTLGATDHPAAAGVLFGAMHSDVALLRHSAAAALATTARGRSLLASVARDVGSPACLLARSVLAALAPAEVVVDLATASVAPREPRVPPAGPPVAGRVRR